MRQQDDKNGEKNGNELTRRFTRTLTSEGKVSYLAMFSLLKIPSFNDFFFLKVQKERMIMVTLMMIVE